MGAVGGSGRSHGNAIRIFHQLRDDTSAESSKGARRLSPSLRMEVLDRHVRGNAGCCRAGAAGVSLSSRSARASPRPDRQQRARPRPDRAVAAGTSPWSPQPAPRSSPSGPGTIGVRDARPHHACPAPGRDRTGIPPLLRLQPAASPSPSRSGPRRPRDVRARAGRRLRDRGIARNVTDKALLGVMFLGTSRSSRSWP